jgi:adenosylmethionine-8-amino-7-oxononanoate aminotransferase
MASSDSRFWHPFADMHATRSAELTIVSGEGVHVTDEEGRRYFDGTASLWNVNVGHGRTELADAAAAQMRELASYSAFGAFSNPRARELTDRLAALAPVDDAKVFLTSGGGDSIDTAAKLARRYFAATGRPERVHLISRSQGYHGTHGLGTSLGGIAANRADVGPLDPHSSQVRHDSLADLEAEIERVGAERVAAVFAEPVIGAGGVHPPQPGYLEAVEALCKRTGVLLVIDAVIAGFGRLGEWFGPERWGLRPDMVVFAKGITSGYLPLGGVVISGTIASPFWDEPNPPWFRHGPTYAGHPTCCAVALANLDIIEREGLLARGLELEGDLVATLRPFESHALVGEVRAGTGALGAVALSADVLAREPKAPMRVWTECRDRGVLVRPLADAVALSPPLIATRDDIEGAASVIADALDAVASELGVTAAA